MKVIESTGKDIEQALANGLAELDCTLDDVDVRILEHPGIFSKARVQFTVPDGKGSGPAASEIMRDLEKRAKDSRRDDRGKRPGSDKQDRRPDRKDNRDNDKNVRREDKPAGAPDRNADASNKQPQAQKGNAQPKQAQQPGSAQQQAKQSEQDRQAKQPEKPQGFRSDFRAELAAAAGETPAHKQEQPERKPEKQPEQRAQQNKAPREVPAEKVAAADEYLRKVVSLMGIEAETVCSAADGEINIELKTEDALAIGRKGETLDALEYLTTLTTAEGDRYIHVNLDCGEYRARRNEAIRAEAIAAADKAVATNRRVELEPMNSASRREVHAALGERGDVITRSEGREPDRRVVIIPRTRGGKDNRGNRNGSGNGRRNNRNRPRHGNKPSGNA